MIKLDFESIKYGEVHLDIAKKSLRNFLKRDEIGFPQLSQRNYLIEPTISLAEELRKKFHTLVIIGIGGSALGPRVIQEVFETVQSTHKLYFCENIDSNEFNNLMLKIPDLNKTAWVVISKSGTTLESLTSLDLVTEIYRQKNITLTDKLTVITEKRENPLFSFATSNNIPILEIPVDVGGRFSVLSPVGMFPAAFLGLPVKEFLAGADQAIRNAEPIEKLTAHFIRSFENNEFITYFWFYSSQLRNFGGWLQQLWAESLGKKFDRDGKPAKTASVPIPSVGAIDQHSILQQVMDMNIGRMVVFTQVEELEKNSLRIQQSLFPQHKYLEQKGFGSLMYAESMATSQALTEVNVPNIILKIEKLNPSSVGYMFMMWQLVVAALGESLNINAFDQPGVELGKRLAKKILNS